MSVILKHVNFVAAVSLVMPDETVICAHKIVTNAKGESEQVLDTSCPVTESQYKFMLDLTAQDDFVKGLSGFDVEFRRSDTRDLLRAQVKIAEMRGYWELDDDTANRLLEAAKNWKYRTSAVLTFNFVPFMRALRQMTTPPAPPEPAA